MPEVGAEQAGGRGREAAALAAAASNKLVNASDGSSGEFMFGPPGTSSAFEPI